MAEERRRSDAWKEDSTDLLYRYIEKSGKADLSSCLLNDGCTWQEASFPKHMRTGSSEWMVPWRAAFYFAQVRVAVPGPGQCQCCLFLYPFLKLVSMFTGGQLKPGWQSSRCHYVTGGMAHLWYQCCAPQV